MIGRSLGFVGTGSLSKRSVIQGASYSNLFVFGDAVFQLRAMYLECLKQPKSTWSSVIEPFR